MFAGYAPHLDPCVQPYSHSLCGFLSTGFQAGPPCPDPVAEMASGAHCRKQKKQRTCLSFDKVNGTLRDEIHHVAFTFDWIRILKQVWCLKRRDDFSMSIKINIGP